MYNLSVGCLELIRNQTRSVNSTLPSIPSLAYAICFHPKMLPVGVYVSKDMIEYYPWQKPNVIRTASSSAVYIAMPSKHRRYVIVYVSLLIFLLYKHVDCLIRVNHIFSYYYYYFLL